MKQNFKWAWRVLRAKSFVVADEKAAFCLLPMREPYSLDTVVMLSSQYSSLMDFRDRLNDVLKQHEQASKQLFGKDIKKGKK